MILIQILVNKKKEFYQRLIIQNSATHGSHVNITHNMSSNKTFYNKYHEKNGKFFSVIRENDLTYFYILPVVRKALELVRAKDLSKINVLDVGCGVGTLAFYLAKKGYAVDAFDISSSAIAICKEFKAFSGMRNIRFYNQDVSNLKTDKRYDIVLCTEVIEHIPDDKHFLQSVSKLMKRNGLLVLSTPSVHAPLYRLGFLKKFDTEVGHLRRYQMETLIKLIETSGFTVLHTRRVESIFRNSFFTFQPLGFFLKFVKGPLVIIFHQVDRFFTSLFGESDLIILAQKK